MKETTEGEQRFVWRGELALVLAVIINSICLVLW